VKIANKISFSFFITALILISIVSPIIYTIEKRDLKKIIFSHLVTIAELKTRHIETFLETQKFAILQLSQSIVLEDFLSANKQATDYDEKFNSAIKKLKRIKEINEFGYEFFVLNTDGKIIASSDRNKIGLDRSTNSYFLGAKKGVYVEGAYHSKTTGEESMAVSAPIIDSKTKKFLGIVVARVKLDMLDKVTIDRTGLGKTGKIYLINKHGYIIAPSRFIKDAFLKLRVDTENTRRGFEDMKEFGSKPHKHEPFIYKDYRGIKVLGMHSHISEMQWILLADIDEKEALAPLSRIKHIFIITLFLIPIIAWLFGLFVSRIVAAPIHRLHKAIEIIGVGNLDYKVDIDVKDEIGQLSRAFNKMVEDLKRTSSSIVILNKEIIERKKVEEALLKAKAFSDSLIASMQDGLSILDNQGVHIDVNPAFCQMTGFSREELIGVGPLHPYWSEDGFEEVKKAFQKTLRGEFSNFELNFVRKNGELFPVIVSPSWIKDKQGNVISYFATVKDITERKKAEQKLTDAYQKLKDTQEQLIQSGKMVAMGQLAAGISHELNQPLTGIKGFAQTILVDIEEENLVTIREDVEKIIEQTNRMDRIIKNIRLFARKSEFRLEELDINQPIEASLMLLKEQLKVHNIHLKKSLGKGLPKIKGDSNQLQQVFLNIITNARDAIDSLKSPSCGELIVESFLSGDKNNIEIIFQDTGCGISKENLVYIFNPFFTTKSPDGGMGLGLSIAYRIIENHKGRIEVKSREGKGTTFRIALPITSTDENKIEKREN